MTTAIQINGIRQAIGYLQRRGITPAPAGPGYWQLNGETLDEAALIARAKAIVLSPALEGHARRYVAARQRSGESLLEAVAELAAARAAAKHGAWHTFLKAIGLDETRAKIQLQIAERAAADPQFADAIRTNIFSLSGAREFLSAPADVQTAVLAGDVPAKVSAIRQAKGANSHLLDAPPRPLVLASGEQVVVDARGREVASNGRAPDAAVVTRETPGEATGPDPALTHACERAERLGATIHYMRDARAGHVWCQPPAGFQPAWIEVDVARLTEQCDAWEKKPNILEKKPNIPERAPAIPADIAEAAETLGLTVEATADGLIGYWPDENPGSIDPLHPDDFRRWLDEEAPAVAAGRMAGARERETSLADARPARLRQAVSELAWLLGIPSERLLTLIAGELSDGDYEAVAAALGSAS